MIPARVQIMSAEVADPRDFVETRSLASVIKEEMGDFSQMAKDMFRDECAKIVLSQIMTPRVTRKLHSPTHFAEYVYAMADEMVKQRDLYRDQATPCKCGSKKCPL
jgi:hypothetical protein